MSNDDKLPVDAYLLAAQLLAAMQDRDLFDFGLIAEARKVYDATNDEIGGAIDHLINYCMEIE